MRSALASVANRRAVRNRSASNLSAIPPAPSTDEYLPELAAVAATIVYRSPLPSPEGHPIFVINAAALPDTFDVDYDTLLPYVLARLPGEDDLITGTEYEIIFFAGGQAESAVTDRKQGPGMGWYLQAYHVLSRAMRKRLQRLYIVHPRTWVRVLISVFSTIVSPKFRRKIIHVGSLSALQQRMPIEDLLMPPSAFMHDRRLDAELENDSLGRAFGSLHPLPIDIDTGQTRLPRLLRETSSFLLLPSNIMTEGLFRIPPHTLLASVLHDAYDRGQKFIVWKEPGSTFAQPDLNRVLLSEVRIEESYGVHLAAALVKTWYRELREPVVPETAYSYIRDHFQDYSRPIKAEDLVAMLDPRSSLSVLTSTSRSILTRHLLPLLSMIASHEQHNKMTAHNLAICFAITLIHGSNQIEDVKMSSVLQRLLTAAIEQWPDIRSRLAIEESAFLDDLKAPSSMSNYEDPVIKTHTTTSAPLEQLDHQITMTEENHTSDLNGHSQPHLQQLPKLLNRLPIKLPQHNAKAGNAAEIKTRPTPPAVPKRKPARSISSPNDDTAPMTETLRSSTLLETVSQTERSDQAEINGREHSASVQSQARVPSEATPAVQPPLIMPKRKAVATTDSNEHEEELASRTFNFTYSLPNDRFSNSAKRASNPIADNNDDSLFRKPSWPASMRRPSDGITSLAKPVLPVIQQSTPLLVTSTLTMPGLPKPRTPSPGLLQRMNSLDTVAMDKAASPDQDRYYKLTPGKLSLRKASVDDLRRLYEERLDTVNGLARSGLMKRSYSHS